MVLHSQDRGVDKDLTGMCARAKAWTALTQFILYAKAKKLSL